MMLEVENINKAYNHNQALKDVSLTISKGSCYGLIGPNGAGKSTLMKVITSIIKADSGHVTFNEKPIQGLTLEKTGYIPQEICLEQTVTAQDNLFFFGRLYGLSGKQLQQRARDVLSHIGLTEKATQKVTAFSGGMKRRLNIGCALMNEPSFILMDEPTVGIDPQSRKYIFSMINRLKSEGCTIIYASHYIEEVEQLCDEVAFIDHGEIIESGPLHDVLNKHTHPTVFVKGNLPLPDFKQHDVRIDKDKHGYLIRSSRPLNIMKQLLNAYDNEAATLTQLELVQPRLEDVFFSLTGSKLRD